MSTSNHHKVVLLGSTGVGKTSTFLRVRDGCFYPDTTDTFDTADIAIKEFCVDENEVKLQIWDTAGMERYRSPTDSYFRNCKAVLFVYAINNKSSFHDLASTWNNYITRYEEMLSNRVPGFIRCKRFLLANKIDLDEDSIEEDLRLSLCERIEVERSFKLSAKSGEGVDETFQEIAKLLNDPHSDHREGGTIKLGEGENMTTSEGTCPC